MTLINQPNTNTVPRTNFLQPIYSFFGFSVHHGKNEDVDDEDDEDNDMIEANNKSYEYINNYKQILEQMIQYQKNVHCRPSNIQQIIDEELTKCDNIIKQLETKKRDRIIYPEINRTTIMDDLKWKIDTYKNACDQAQQCIDTITEAIKNDQSYGENVIYTQPSNEHVKE